MELDFPIATLDTRKQQEQYPKNSEGKLFRTLKCIPKVLIKGQNKRKIPSEGWGFKNWLPVHPFLRNNCRASLMVQWLRLWASTAEDMGSISSQKTKILHAAQCGQKERKSCRVLPIAIRKIIKIEEDIDVRKYGNSTRMWKMKFPRWCSSCVGSIKTSKSRVGQKSPWF